MDRPSTGFCIHLLLGSEYAASAIDAESLSVAFTSVDGWLKHGFCMGSASVALFAWGYLNLNEIYQFTNLKRVYEIQVIILILFFEIITNLFLISFILIFR